MSKHTAGPWTAKKDSVRQKVCMDDGTWFYCTSYRVYNNHDQRVAEVSSFHNEDGSPSRGTRLSESEVQPSARLIATSPDLFALANRVANLNEHAGEIGAGMLASLVEDARNAIAKATGGEG